VAGGDQRLFVDVDGDADLSGAELAVWDGGAFGGGTAAARVDAIAGVAALRDEHVSCAASPGWGCELWVL